MRRSSAPSQRQAGGFRISGVAPQGAPVRHLSEASRLPPGTLQDAKSHPEATIEGSGAGANSAQPCGKKTFRISSKVPVSVNLQPPAFQPPADQLQSINSAETVISSPMHSMSVLAQTPQTAIKLPTELHEATLDEPCSPQVDTPMKLSTSSASVPCSSKRKSFSIPFKGPSFVRPAALAAKSESSASGSRAQSDAAESSLTYYEVSLPLIVIRICPQSSVLGSGCGDSSADRASNYPVTGFLYTKEQEEAQSLGRRSLDLFRIRRGADE
jgi:hypothetical protein